jgi:hypothetical protein
VQSNRKYDETALESAKVAQSYTVFSRQLNQFSGKVARYY